MRVGENTTRTRNPCLSNVSDEERAFVARYSSAQVKSFFLLDCGDMSGSS